MRAAEFLIVEYKSSNEPDLLGLLLELHVNYFHKNASRTIQEFSKEKDVKKSYKEYINHISKNEDDTWKIYLAVASGNKIIGFIIGSVFEDKHLVRNRIGKLEDWYVEDNFREMGVGMKLYNELEKWFIQEGCRQVSSDTWFGNESGVTAHKKLGFVISGFTFGKRLD